MMTIWISYELVFVFLVDRCPSSILVCYHKKKSVRYMGLLFSFLCLVYCPLFAIATSAFRGLTYEELINPIEWFQWCRNVLVSYAVSSICNQLISITVHRPIDILYNIQYISMFVVQILGFIVCIMLAFCLGMKYAKVNRKTDIVVYYNNKNCL